MSNGPSRWPEPYRVLFPLGVLYGLIGAGAWPAHVAGLGPYPGPLHRLLMIEGFEHSFVLGFLLTAMPGFTKGERCRPAELALAAAAMVGLGVAAVSGRAAIAHALFAGTLVLVAVAVLRRLATATTHPPDELLFVAFALAAGVCGSVLQLAGAAGTPSPLPPGLAERLVSLGMVLPLVLGLGTLLVPTFAGIPGALAIPALAAPHQRGGGRRALYLTLLVLLATSFALDASGRASAGALARAVVATVMLLLGWKIFRRPGHATLHAWSLWSSGWLTLAGVWLAALAPPWATTGVLHVLFIGGFGLLTLAIATRVVVAHGRHGLAAEHDVLTGGVVTMLAITLIVRLAAEFVPARALHVFALAGFGWVATWVFWALGAVPRIVHTQPAPPASSFVPVAKVNRSGARPGASQVREEGS